MNETSIRSANDERSIHNTHHESIAISMSGRTIKRSMNIDSRVAPIRTTSAEDTPLDPVHEAALSRIDAPSSSRTHSGVRATSWSVLWAAESVSRTTSFA
jgi:hypothetical protein